MLKVDYISPDGKLIESFEMADGMTLEQAARTICPDSGGKFPVPTIAIVGAKPAVRDLGDWDYPLAGACVQFRQLAMGGGGGGGGSNPLQMVLQIAIIAAAAFATWYIGGLGGELLGIGMTFWGGLAGAGIMMLGTMLMGALFPQSLPQGQVGAFDAQQASPTYNINSSGNQARLNQTEPECFGRMKLVPDFVANTWTQYIGNDQIGYFVYGIGRGLYDVESLQFGETVFWRDGALVEDSGYEIQELEFVKPGHPVTIFPDNVITSQEVSGQELFAPNDEEFTGAIGPYATNAPGTKTNKLLFDFVFQRGLGKYDNSGNLQYFTVSWKIEYRAIDDFGNPLSEWAVLDEPSETNATLTPQRITKTYDVAKGRYETRVIRTSGTDSGGTTMDSLVWGSLRAMLPGTYEYPISCIAFSIRANNALTQNASRQFSAIVTRKLPLYDRKRKVWSEEVPTRSWAAAVSHVARCEWGGRLKDSSIDLDTLWAIDERLQAKNWHYDAYIDGPNLVWNLLCEMCQSQCVIPRLVGPVLSFVQDAPNRQPSFALTPRNIMRNSFSVTYSTWSDETPDDVTMEYLDNAYGFQQRDVTAKLPESESKEPASLDILGITDRDHAHKVAIAYAAHNRWQRIIVECQVEALGRIINRGDICTVAHPRFKNTSSGAVDSWDEARLEICVKTDHRAENDDGFYIVSPYDPKGEKLMRLGDFGLDMGKTIEEFQESSLSIDPYIFGDKDDLTFGENSHLSLVRQDGSIWGPCKIASFTNGKFTLDLADYSTLLMQGQGNPFEWLTSGIDRQPTIWTLYDTKIYQRLMVVDSISSQDMLHYNLRLLNYDERIYQYNNLPTPPWQGRGQLPVFESLGIPDNFRGIVQDNASVLLVWSTVAGANWYEVEISTDKASWTRKGRTNVNQMLVSVSPDIVYARVRAMTDTIDGSWTYWEGDRTAMPPAMPKIRLSESYEGGSALVSWNPVDGAEQYSLALRADNRTFYSTRTKGISFAISPELQDGGPYRTFIVAVAAIGKGGASQEAKLKLEDLAPQAPADAQISIGAGNVTLLSVAGALPSDATGYVLLKGTGHDFGMHDVLEMRQTSSLPYTWAGLTPGTHYFRIAVKDAFFEIARNPLSLNWSAVLSVTIE